MSLQTILADDFARAAAPRIVLYSIELVGDKWIAGTSVGTLTHYNSDDEGFAFRNADGEAVVSFPESVAFAAASLCY